MTHPLRIEGIFPKLLVMFIDFLLTWTPLDFTNLDIWIMTPGDFNNNFTSIFRYKILADTPNSMVREDYSMSMRYTNVENPKYALKNSYGDLCKIYWMHFNGFDFWKKYVGFNYYNRFFEFLDDIPDMNQIFKEYDVILPEKTQIKSGLNYVKEFKLLHGPYIDEIIEIIKKHYPDYYKTAVMLMNETEAYSQNMFIMRQRDFLAYGDFVFGVLNIWEAQHKFRKDKDVQNFINSERAKKIPGVSLGDARAQYRIQEHIGNRLANIFFHHYFKKPKHYRIVYGEIYKNNPAIGFSPSALTKVNVTPKPNKPPKTKKHRKGKKDL